MAARRFRDAARPARAHPRGHGDRRRDRHSVARGTARRRAVARDGRKGRARAAWRRPEIRVARRDFETRRSRRDKIAIVALAKARLARTGRIRTTRRGGEARGGSLGRGAGRRAAARKTATARGARSSWARSSARCRTRVTADSGRSGMAMRAPFVVTGMDLPLGGRTLGAPFLSWGRQYGRAQN